MAFVSHPEITIAGAPVSLDHVHGITVEQDLDQPDMCTVTLNNNHDSTQYSSSVNHGDALEVKIKTDSQSSTVLFKGEVVGVEPVFDSASRSRVTIRAFNLLHRLSRGRRSRTYEKMTDTDMVSKIASDNSLTPKTTRDVNVQYDHVYQHNQTDLEFLLQRAARIDYEIFVDDKTLNFRKRDVSSDSGLLLKLDVRQNTSRGNPQLLRFLPRMTTAGMVQEVTVRSWDPVKKEEVVGKATSQGAKLGATDGPSAASTPFSTRKYIDVDVPVGRVDAADAMAKSKFEELSMNFITGDALCVGDPRLKAGIVVHVGVDCRRFDGKYYIVGCAHRYVHDDKSGGKGGYLTSLKVRRNAEK